MDYLVNNAGRSIRRSLDLSYDRFHDFERTMAVNFFGPVRLTMGLLPAMRAQRFGHVVNIVTWGVQVKAPKFSAYIASKTALDTWSRIAGREAYADNVTFTNIRLSLVRTPMVAPTEAYAGLPAATPEQTAERICRALEDRPVTVDTLAGSVAEVVNLVAPRLSDALFSRVDRRFPDSAAARGSADATRPAPPEPSQEPHLGAQEHDTSARKNAHLGAQERTVSAVRRPSSAAVFLAAVFLAAPSWRRSSSRRPSCGVFFAGFFAAASCPAVRPASEPVSEPGVLAAGLLGGGDRLLQRGQQVDDLAGGLGRGRGALDLAALDLGLDHLLHRVGVVVLELRGVEVAGQGVDEHVRHLHLGVLDLADLDREVGTRTSSGHIIVCSTITSSLTRSTAMLVRWRSATVTTAIRSASMSACRSSA